MTRYQARERLMAKASEMGARARADHRDPFAGHGCTYVTERVAMAAAVPLSGAFTRAWGRDVHAAYLSSLEAGQ